MDCQVDQAISDIIVHEWTKFEKQIQDNVKLPGYWEASFISNDHLIMITRFGQVYTFHLKEHYWSQFEIQMSENNKYLTKMACLVRPNLIVEFQTAQQNEKDSTASLSILTWETDQGVAKNFCQRVQKLNIPLPSGVKEMYPDAIYSDGISLYVFGGYYGEDKIKRDSIYQINLETYEVLERKLEREKPYRKYNNFHSPGDVNRESVFYNGKLYALAREKGENGQIGLWVFDFDEMNWEKLQDAPTGRFESYALEFGCHVTRVNDEIFIYSIKDQEKHSTILNYDLKKKSWTDGFLIINSPKITPFSLEPLLVYQNSFISLNTISDGQRGPFEKTSLSVSSLRVPSEHERSTKEEIKAHMENLCEGKTEPDVVFKVEDQEFPANKSILSYRSSYFKNAFSSNMVESRSDVIPINDVRPKVFKALLQHIYLEEFEIEDDILEDLFKLANEYNMKKLSTDCQKKLIKKITIENAISYVLFAEKYGAEKLRKACLFFIIKNCEQVFKTPNFKDLNGDVCYEIVKLSNYYTNRDSKRDEVELLMI